MSAYHEYETVLTDQDCLVTALKEMGYNPNVYEIPQQLQGYHGDLRKQVANVIIPRSQVGGASNDVGYLKGADGRFKAIISEFDGHGNFGVHKQNALAQQYAVAKHTKSAKKVGAKVVSKENKLINGKMCMVMKLQGK